jgi:hypothetical protein
MQESTNAKDWMIKNLVSYLVLAHFKPAIEAAAIAAQHAPVAKEKAVLKASLMTKDEIIRRLRVLKQPITVFGETNEQRYERLLFVAEKTILVYCVTTRNIARLSKEVRNKAQLQMISADLVAVEEKAKAAVATFAKTPLTKQKSNTKKQSRNPTDCNHHALEPQQPPRANLYVAGH